VENGVAGVLIDGFKVQLPESLELDRVDWRAPDATALVDEFLDTKTSETRIEV
jgi:hypothetical protein